MVKACLFLFYKNLSFVMNLNLNFCCKLFEVVHWESRTLGACLARGMSIPLEKKITFIMKGRSKI